MPEPRFQTLVNERSAENGISAGPARKWTEDMRLDKFLKVSRVIKRRTVANEACDASHVLVNDKPAKASYEVKTGDVIEIRFGSRTMKLRVRDVKEHTLKAEAADLYEVIP